MTQIMSAKLNLERKKIERKVTDDSLGIVILTFTGKRSLDTGMNPVLY